MTAGSHRLIPLESRVEWCAALEGIPHGFAHTWENCDAMQRTTGLPTFLYCFERGNTRIACPIAERKLDDFVDIVTPYGYSGFVGTESTDEFPRLWSEFAKQRGYVCGYIGLNPALRNNGYVDPATVVPHNDVYLLDLTSDPQKLWEALSEKRRKQLRDWETVRTNIVQDRQALSRFFFEQYERFFVRKKADQAYAGFTHGTLEKLLGSGSALVIGAPATGSLEAVFVFTFTPHAAEGLFNISTEKGREFTAMLTWFGVKYLKEHGIPVLNLGGGVHPNDGMAEFKRRFGAKRVPLESARQVYRRDVYDRLCRAASVSPDMTSGYFPPYRVRGTPGVAAGNSV